MAEIAEIEEISHFDNLMTRAMAEIDNVDVLNDCQDPIKRQQVHVNKATNEIFWFPTCITTDYCHDKANSNKMSPTSFFDCRTGHNN